MCLILLSTHDHPRFDLVVAANRDEYHARPSVEAEFWKDSPSILAGRDLEGGGTWMGVTRSGRFAAVTNYREAGPKDSAAPSRGLLVRRFLEGEQSAEAYLDELAGCGDRYAGFCLLAYDGRRIGYFSNRATEAAMLTPGAHGLSNGLIDDPWPKVTRGTAALEALLARSDRSEEVAGALIELLADATPAPDAELPDTGFGLDRERVLSSIFIKHDRYGTRSSTALIISKDRRVLFVEKSFGPGGNPGSVRRHEFVSVSSSKNTARL